MKVDFIIVGAQKSGTTTLASILSTHPLVSFCISKEPNFWCGTSDWRKDIDTYHDKFMKGEGMVYGEASTSYSMLPFGDLRESDSERFIISKGAFSIKKAPYKLINTNVFDLIHEYNPSIKIIYIVRNPFARIESAYNHYYQRRYLNQGINAALIEDRSLIDLTRYWTQISPYIKKFGPDQVLVLNFERIKHDQAGLVQKVYEFIGLSQPIPESKDEGSTEIHLNSKNFVRLPYYLDFLPGTLRVLLRKIVKNRVSKHSKLSDESKRLIALMLREEITNISEYLDEDLTDWFEGY